MPLVTQVRRGGKPRKDIPWNGGEGNAMERNAVAEAVLNAFLTTAMKEGDPNLAFSGERTFGDLEPGQFVNLAATGVYYIDTKCPLWRHGEMKLKDSHTYFEGTSFEVTFRAGDVLVMRRESSR